MNETSPARWACRKNSLRTRGSKGVRVRFVLGGRLARLPRASTACTTQASAATCLSSSGSLPRAEQRPMRFSATCRAADRRSPGRWRNASSWTCAMAIDWAMLTMESWSCWASLIRPVSGSSSPSFPNFAQNPARLLGFGISAGWHPGDDITQIRSLVVSGVVPRAALTSRSALISALRGRDRLPAGITSPEGRRTSAPDGYLPSSRATPR